MNYIDLLQWPAMAVTIAASWLVASSSAGRRNTGFWVFMVSNVLWIAWGVYSHAPALVVLQVCLAVMNIRGEITSKKKEKEEKEEKKEKEEKREGPDEGQPEKSASSRG